MKLNKKYKPYSNNPGHYYIKIPSFIIPEEKYLLEVLEDGTLIYSPVECK